MQKIQDYPQKKEVDEAQRENGQGQPTRVRSPVHIYPYYI
jgi:hypothetical protein